MVEVAAVASAYDRQQRALSRRIAAEVARQWRRLDQRFLDHSWNAAVGPRILAAVAGGQMLAAAAADDYLDRVLDAQNIDPDAAGAVAPRSLSGVASDGRDLASLLYEPVIAVKTAIGQGADVAKALTGGLLSLDMITRTQLADAGRVATGVGITARRHVDGYVRMLNPPSCSRCAILAGRWYRWNAGFRRHPRCDCVAIPSQEDESGDLRTDPKAYFASLTEADQNRLFTRSGAQAIRDGADINQVVNVRREGALYTAGGRRLTREGTTSRGFFGGYERGPNGEVRRRPDSGLVKRGGRYRESRRARLTPEQIYADAHGDRDEAIRLLRENGFLV